MGHDDDSVENECRMNSALKIHREVGVENKKVFMVVFLTSRVSL